MKRIVSVLAMILFLSPPVMAETYTWTDKNGTVNFSDDYSNVPKQYRKKVLRHGDMDHATPAPAHTGPGDGQRQPVPPSVPETAKIDAAGTYSGNGLYDGRKAEAWQQEFRTRETEVKQLENQLVQLEELIKKPAGISQERMQGLPQEFRETQKRYNEALKVYNDLNAAANKAQLPAEFRK